MMSIKDAFLTVYRMTRQHFGVESECGTEHVALSTPIRREKSLELLQKEWLVEVITITVITMWNLGLLLSNV